VSTTRRSLLRAGLGALGFGALVAAAHRVMKGGQPAYPVSDPRRVQPSGAPDLEAPVEASQPESPRLLRPPGAVDEAGFLATCIRCTRCQEVCDEGAIQFFSETGGRHAHTPYVDPSRRACTLCMKCTRVCPSRALEPIEERDYAAVAMGSVVLHEELCLSHRARRIRDEQDLLHQLGRSATEAEAPTQRRGPCGECHMVCPVKDRAITLLPGAFLAPEVHPDDCAGCGLCEWICRRVTRGRPAIRVVQTRAWS